MVSEVATSTVVLASRKGAPLELAMVNRSKPLFLSPIEILLA